MYQKITSNKINTVFYPSSLLLLSFFKVFAITAEDMHARLFFRHVGIVRESVVTCIYANTIDLLQNIKSTFYGEDS